MTPHRQDLDSFIVDSSPDGIMVFDYAGTVIKANAAADRMLGHGPGETLGLHISTFIPSDSQERHAADHAAYMRAPESRPMGLGRELHARRADGTELAVEISLSPLSSGPDSLVVATLRDVSERRALRNLGAATLAAAERERRRIAQELHDDVLQRLAALLLSITMISRRPDHPDLDALLDVRQRLEDVADRLRRLARGLRPRELQEVGLELALRRLVREAGEAGGPEIKFRCDLPDDQVPEAVALALFRIVQEGVWNAHRHANATEIEVSASCNGTWATVVVADDGSGFDYEAARKSDRGLGLRGMFERSAAVRGRLEVVSEPGQGTRITAELPYDRVTPKEAAQR